MPYQDSPTCPDGSPARLEPDGRYWCEPYGDDPPPDDPLPPPGGCGCEPVTVILKGTYEEVRANARKLFPG